MIALLGIDCATNPKKTGLALGELHGDVVHIQCCATGTRHEFPAMIAARWLSDYTEAIIALDAPLGWPKKMGVALSEHRAGRPFQIDANQLFRRATDVEIKKRLKKQPLDVGANLIARTAVAALEMLDQIRLITKKPIPLAWAPREPDPWRAIEVYPAATRIAHGLPDAGGSFEGLENLLDCSAVFPALMQSRDAVDAAVCALGAADFLCGRAISPVDHNTALIEGWIWAPMLRQ
jgi:predicted nuclease with RNAse H fold